MAYGTRRVLRNLAAGMAVGAVAFAIGDAVRPRPGRARIIDWDEIRDSALGRLDPADAIDGRRRRRLQTPYRALSWELAAPLLDFVGGMDGSFPPFQALDRHGWVDLNVGI